MLIEILFLQFYKKITANTVFMKILHTADWHLGHRLHEQSQFEEQQLFLDWLTNWIIDEQYEVLLLSGDVFDTGMPSNQSLAQYYNFLVGLQNTCCKHIVITGGNHDAPGTLNAPKQLLNALNIKVVGKATDDIIEEVFEIHHHQETILVAAVPYLRDQDVRKAVAGESFDDINERYKSALIKHYQVLADHCNKINESKNIVIAMGHLFAIGGSVSDSEKDISVGNLGHIGADDFPEEFDYIALGHLHRPQEVGGKNHIRYSGSPNVLSFSEIGYQKKVVGLLVQENSLVEINEITVPNFRVVQQIKGTMDDCITQLGQITTNDYGLVPWVEVVLENDSGILDTSALKVAAEVVGVQILKVTFKNQQNLKGLEVLMESAQKVKNLDPMEVFEKKCDEYGIVLAEEKALVNAFQEILLLARENNQ